jgi:hypothetical protein
MTLYNGSVSEISRSAEKCSRIDGLTKVVACDADWIVSFELPLHQVVVSGTLPLSSPPKSFVQGEAIPWDLFPRREILDTLIGQVCFGGQ